LTDEQRSRSGKDRQPSGLSSGELLAALLLSRRTLAGYAPSSRLASPSPKLSALIPYL